ncbi:hypothetical protein C8R43DRAFT_1130663 [Mycena crocata]|nr:hypothetical protein C8R43DRAFT_1130663 [Mycena crocata]
MGNAPSAPPAQHSPTSPRVSQSTPTQNKNHFPRREAPPSPTATRTSTKPPPAPVTPTTKSTPTTSTTTATTSTTRTPPPSDAGTASPSLRPNRKSIDLPGLNTFAPAPAALPHSRLGSRIVERGRQWAHRAGAGHPSHHNANGSYVNGNGAHHGGGVGGSGYGAGTRGGMRGGTPPRSAAIAIPIPGRRGEGEAVEEEDTGYGYHAREGIARRKKEEKEREERG